MTSLATGAARQLRPLAVGEVLDVGIKLVRRNVKAIAKIVVFVALPLEIISTLGQLAVAPKGAVVTGFPPHLVSPEPYKLVNRNGVLLFERTDITNQLFGDLVIFVISILAITLAAGACFRMLTSSYLSEPTTWTASLGVAVRKLHSLVWVAALAWVLPTLSLVACIVPGVYLWAAFAVVVPVLLTENRRGFKAIGRSRELVSGFWWRSFGIMVFGLLLAVIASAVVEGGVDLVSSAASPRGLAVWAVTTTVGGTLGLMITTPLMAAFAIVLYFDLRVRKEGFDLQLLSGQIGVEPAPGWSATGPSLSAQPPYWPPPPGWTPPAPPQGSPSPPPDPGAAPDPPPSAEPPFWPPPPGWAPPGASR